MLCHKPKMSWTKITLQLTVQDVTEHPSGINFIPYVGIVGCLNFQLCSWVTFILSSFSLFSLSLPPSVIPRAASPARTVLIKEAVEERRWTVLGELVRLTVHPSRFHSTSRSRLPCALDLSGWWNRQTSGGKQDRLSKGWGCRKVNKTSFCPINYQCGRERW